MLLGGVWLVWIRCGFQGGWFLLVDQNESFIYFYVRSLILFLASLVHQDGI